MDPCRRTTKHDYAEPGSFDRILEAALAYADADSEDDEGYWRARSRLVVAVLQFRMPGRHRRRAIEEIEAQMALPMKGGRAPRLISLARAIKSET